MNKTEEQWLRSEDIWLENYLRWRKMVKNLKKLVSSIRQALTFVRPDMLPQKEMFFEVAMAMRRAREKTKEGMDIPEPDQFDYVLFGYIFDSGFEAGAKFVLSKIEEELESPQYRIKS